MTRRGVLTTIATSGFILGSTSGADGVCGNLKNSSFKTERTSTPADPNFNGIIDGVDVVFPKLKGATVRVLFGYNIPSSDEVDPFVTVTSSSATDLETENEIETREWPLDPTSSGILHQTKPPADVEVCDSQTETFHGVRLSIFDTNLGAAKFANHTNHPAIEKSSLAGRVDAPDPMVGIVDFDVHYTLSQYPMANAFYDPRFPDGIAEYQDVQTWVVSDQLDD